MAEVKAEKLRLQSARKREKQKELSSSSATFSFASWLVAFLPTFFFCVWPCLFIDHSRGPVPTRRRTLLLNFHAPNRMKRHLATGASTDTKLHNNDEEEKRREIFTVLMTLMCRYILIGFIFQLLQSSIQSTTNGIARQ